MMERSLAERDTVNATLGYVTKDVSFSVWKTFAELEADLVVFLLKKCPGVGDDVVHTAIPFFDTPDFIASPNPNVTADTPIDLVFVDFIESVRPLSSLLSLIFFDM